MLFSGVKVGAVVVGFDRYFNYYNVQYRTLCVRENPGCLFLATNRDVVTHLTDAQEWANGYKFNDLFLKLINCFVEKQIWNQQVANMYGVTSLSMFQNPNNSIQPDFYTNKISDFLTLKAATVIRHIISTTKLKAPFLTKKCKTATI
ncbi:hypothetical protein LXL04_036103 [Taraxacum kok-saghyz]